jgi:hypothetical protein
LIPLGDERITDVVSIDPAAEMLPLVSIAKAFEREVYPVPLPIAKILLSFISLYLPITN